MSKRRGGSDGTEFRHLEHRSHATIQGPPRRPAARALARQEGAEGIAEQMNRSLIHDIATKGDIEALRSELKGDIASLRVDLKADIASARGEARALACELTVKIYTVGLAVVALVVAAQKLLP